MPATRITVASNAKQSQRAPLIISPSAYLDPSQSKSARFEVLKVAQTKLRLKKPSRIFVSGTGKELETEDDWTTTIENDVVLLVSTGEEYVGIKKDDNPNIASLSISSEATTLNMAKEAIVESQALQQLEVTAKSLPGILHGVGQPDLHPGNKYPIGAVFISKGWIHPPLIGGDIGCGMAWYRTTLTQAQVSDRNGNKVASSLRGLEGSWRSQEDRLNWLAAPVNSEANRAHFSAGVNFDASLGTIGAGNHFAELQVVEAIDQESWEGQSPQSNENMPQIGDVLLLVHSGSRGYGGDILKRFTTKGDSLRADSAEATDYLSEHDRACAWADRNRDLIALRFLSCLEPNESTWNIGSNDVSDSNLEKTNVKQVYDAIQSRKVVEICHNNMARSLWPPQCNSFPQSLSKKNEVGEASTKNVQTGIQEQVFIHRKGAAPISPYRSSCEVPSTTILPILPLPGSRGTPTLILHPTVSDKNSWGAINALSLAHGAGRAMSRAKALSVLSDKHDNRSQAFLRGDYQPTKGNPLSFRAKQAKKIDEIGSVAEDERQGRMVQGGTWVVCEDKKLVWEEAPEAYKDVWDVGKDLVDAGAAERVGWCRGVVSYKVRKE